MSLKTLLLSLLLLTLAACGPLLKCVKTNEWKVGGFSVLERKCEDLAYKPYLSYEVYSNDARVGSATKEDSCRFEKFANDWNNSQVRNYSNKKTDSAFDGFPA